MTHKQIMNWLLDSDISIQYQVYRDLLDKEKSALQKRISSEGWGYQFLKCRQKNGHWGQGFYQPKWISTHYTLLDLKNLNIYPGNKDINKSIQLIFDTEKGPDGGINPIGSVKASISENLKQLGMVLSPELEKKVLDRVIEMGDQGIIVSTEDLPFLIANLSGEDLNTNFQILNCEVVSGKGISPQAKLKVRYKSQEFNSEGKGDGGYDAFMDALAKIAQANNFQLPELLDYQVRIPPGGKTSALVETIITWSGSLQNSQTNSFRTIGLDSDQISAAILATEKMLNLILK